MTDKEQSFEKNHFKHSSYRGSRIYYYYHHQKQKQRMRNKSKQLRNEEKQILSHYNISIEYATIF